MGFQSPWFRVKLESDGKENEKDGKDTVDLTIKHMEAEFPSYDELDSNDFPVAVLDSRELIPEAATDVRFHQERSVNADTFASAFQVNFIRGGLILGMAVSRNVSDGPGINGFLTNWAKASRAVATGSRFQLFDPVDLDRSRLNPTSIPDAARMAELQKEVPILKHRSQSPPAPSADNFVMPEFSPVMWHFPTSRHEKLKALCKPVDGKSWVSTYDCIMGLLHKTVTRAELPLLNLNMSSLSKLMYAVSNRQLLDPSLPEGLLGNAVTPSPTDIRSIQDVIDMDLTQAAALVRGSILEVTPEHIRRLAEWVAGTPDKSSIAVDLDFFLGPDLLGTSWTKMTSYTSHDFEFGLPQAMRWPKCDWDSTIFAYPRGVKDDPEEGFEYCVCLEKGCQERLMMGLELLEFASPRGL